MRVMRDVFVDHSGQENEMDDRTIANNRALDSVTIDISPSPLALLTAATSP